MISDTHPIKFNIYVVTLWCFNLVVREILTLGRVFHHFVGDFPMVFQHSEGPTVRSRRDPLDLLDSCRTWSLPGTLLGR